VPKCSFCGEERPAIYWETDDELVCGCHEREKVDPGQGVIVLIGILILIFLLPFAIFIELINLFQDLK